MIGIIIIIIMPIVAILGIFTGSIDINTDRLHEMISEQQSVSMERWTEVENAMTNAGYDASRIQERRRFLSMSYTFTLKRRILQIKLVGCFAENQTDESLINAVNAAFGTQIDPADFSKIMASVRSSYIDTSGYTDLTTKNNLDLVKWAEFAYSKGWGYVWGNLRFGVRRETAYEQDCAVPERGRRQRSFIRQNWLGGRTADCVGLIKGYGWLNPESHQVEYGTNGMPDIARTRCMRTP